MHGSQIRRQPPGPPVTNVARLQNKYALHHTYQPLGLAAAAEVDESPELPDPTLAGGAILADVPDGAVEMDDDITPETIGQIINMTNEEIRAQGVAFMCNDVVRT